MTKIVKLHIKNFRGIKNLLLDFMPNQDLICLIGRGDSGKTTVLDALSLALSPSWNPTFYVTDFYQCNLGDPIEIEVSLIDFPHELKSENKFGLLLRALNPETNKIVDDVVHGDISPSPIPVLTIKLSVDESLEPSWTVTSHRDHDEKISASDRARINCFLISDYIDRHFSWNKGSPLFALLKSIEVDGTPDHQNVILQSLIKAKEAIDQHDFDGLTEATSLLKEQAVQFGLDISEVTTTLDFRELSIRDSRASLHEGAIPFRQKGKGSKRLTSMAIQSALVQSGGIMLIDEIEQGLEPDRIKHLCRHLKESHIGQVFITTHSRDAIEELGADSLLLLLKEKETDQIDARHLFEGNDDKLKAAVRACPEAFFAKKVIVCEGATEIGVCRALGKWRRKNGKPQMSFKDTAYVDGTGSTLTERCIQISKCMKTALICDSDNAGTNSSKEAIRQSGVKIFDCENDLCLEQQVFKDMPWEGVKRLLTYAQEHHIDSFNNAFSEYVASPVAQWGETDELRQKIISEFRIKENGSSGKKWFKAIHHGEALGDIVFEHFEQIDSAAQLKAILDGLSNWIDNGEA